MTNQPLRASGRSADGLGALRRFGQDAEGLVQPSIAVGGFIVPGDAAVAGDSRQEETSSGRKRPEGAEEAGPPARPWAGPSGEATASGEGPHAVGALTGGHTGARELDELAAYYPDVRRAASSPTRPGHAAAASAAGAFDVFTMRLGLFPDLPYRARLYLEVPVVTAFNPRVLPGLSMTPPVRAWSFWDAGPEMGMQLVSHHEYPDGAMCVCMAEDWVRGRDLLVDYVNFCVCWIAKMLHDQAFGFYPGRQHLPEHLRRKRARPDEYCGCGAPRRYRVCHRAADMRHSEDALLRQRRESQRRYRAALQAQGRPMNPLQLIGLSVTPGGA